MPNSHKAIFDCASKASQVICADSGVDAALKAGCRIDKVYGDLDSISEDGLSYIKKNNIPLEVFPCEKDMTDTELVLSEVTNSNVVLFCALKGRIDHVMANVLMCARLKLSGLNVLVTDGESQIRFLSGGEKFVYKSSSVREMVSLLPADISNPVTGVTTKGLYYELNDATLNYGSSLGVSNYIKDPGTFCEISIKSGIIGVYVVPEE